MEKVLDHAWEIALIKAIENIVGHVAGDGLLGNGGGVEEGTVFGAMMDEAAGFHFAEHGSDGGISEGGLGSELLVDVGDGGGVMAPEDFHDLQLEIAEAEFFMSGRRHDGMAACIFKFK